MTMTFYVSKKPQRQCREHRIEETGNESKKLLLLWIKTTPLMPEHHWCSCFSRLDGRRLWVGLASHSHYKYTILHILTFKQYEHSELVWGLPPTILFAVSIANHLAIFMCASITSSRDNDDNDNKNIQWKHTFCFKRTYIHTHISVRWCK